MQVTNEDTEDEPSESEERTVQRRRHRLKDTDAHHKTGEEVVTVARIQVEPGGSRQCSRHNTALADCCRLTQTPLPLPHPAPGLA